MRALCLIVAGLVLALAACGGGGDDEGGNGDGGEQAADEAAAAAEAEAAREQELAAKVRRLIPIARMSQTGKSRKEQIRISTAEFQLGTIAGKSLQAVRPLIRALEQRDYELIADLAGFYVALGKPGSQPILAETVARFYPSGDQEYTGLPFELLGAGNARLEREVTDALESQGFTVSGQPSFTSLQWGSSGAYGKVPTLPPGVVAPPAPPP